MRLLGAILAACQAPAKAAGSRPEPAGRSAISVDAALAEARDAFASMRLADALAALDRAGSGDAPEVALLRGRIYLAWHRHAEAARTLAAIDPEVAVDDPDALLALASAAAWRDDHAAARLWYERALAKIPGDARAILGRARTLLRAGELASAAQDARAVLAADARNTDAVCLLATIHRSEGRTDLAEGVLRAGIDASPECGELMRELAVLLSSMQRDAEALDWLDRVPADQRGGRFPVERAIGLRRVGRESEGLSALVDALARMPVLDGHLELGPALLSAGAFDEGWRQYEHRWFVPPLAEQRADIGVPQWRGQPLEGRTILVRLEQGFGDTFQHARFLPQLKARGAKVVVLPLQGLDAMAQRFPGVDHVLRIGERYPPLDYYANLMSLPLGFGTREESIPSVVPYLRADAGRRERWAPRFPPATKPRVGFVWAGRPEHARDRLRSMTIAQLAPVLSIPDVQFVSLQKGSAAVQAEEVPEWVDWDSVGPELVDFDDTAAVIEHLDLLLCVDTGVAHLAGAMGKDVWMMLPSPADFRWMSEREDTPWYPTMRLFRQPAPGNWGDVVERVTGELRRWIGTRGMPSRLAPQQADRTPRYEPVALPATLARAVDTRVGLLQYLPHDRSGRSLEHYGEWMQRALDTMCEHLAPGAVVVEVGAGVGAHTIALARRVGERGLVLAFECDPRSRAALALNLSTHRCRHATVLPGPPGDASPGAHDGAPIDDLRLPVLESIVVSDRADAGRVLTGARETLWRCRPWIVAMGASEDALRESRELLREPGYAVWRGSIPIHARGNFNRREDDAFDGASLAWMIAFPEERGRPELPAGLAPWL